MNPGSPRAALAGALAVLVLIVALPAVVRAESIILGTVGGLDKAFGPLFMARQLGYFKKEKLDVEVINFAGTGVLYPQVASNRVQVGFPTAEPLVLSRAPGNPSLPVMFFYDVLRTNVWEIAVLDGSPVHRLADLKGKKIGIIAFSAGSLPITKAMLEEAGLKEKDYEFVPVGLGAAAILALKSGQVDALNLFDTVDDQMAANGIKVRLIPRPEKYANLFSNSFVSSEEMIKDHPGVLVRFGRAIAKGTVACEANIPACYKAVWTNDPTQRPPNMSDTEALRYALKVNYRRLNAMKAPPGHYGEFDVAPWQTLVESLHAGGQLSTTGIPLDSLYTNAFVHQVNSFDYNAVIQDATSLK